MDRRVTAEDEAARLDGPWELPEGWVWTALKRIADVNPSTSFDGFRDDQEITFIPMAAVSEESGAIDLSQRRLVQDVIKGYTRFADGDVIFAKITPCMENGKVSPVSGLAHGVAAGSTEFHVVRPLAAEQRYLWYWLVSRSFRNRAQRSMHGAAGQLRVSAEFLREECIPLAPLPEQKRIVNRIDALFAEIAEGEAALNEARRGLETFRRSLLKAAVTGELTREWRESHHPTENGHDLLARIRAERDGKAPRKGRGRRTAAVVEVGNARLPELPKGWAWAKLGELIKHLTSGSRDWSDYYDRGDRIFVMAQNVRMGRYCSEPVKNVDPPTNLKDVERSKIQKWDILITIVGANTGDVCLIKFDASHHHVCQSVALLRPILFEIAEFVEAYLTAPDGGQADIERYTYGAGRPHLSFDQIESIQIPIPPPTEMTEILTCVRSALDSVEDTRALLDAEAADAARLRQSILKAAFEGCLVPQDPDDEPAAQLLSRLGTSATAPKRRGRKPKGRAT